MTVLDNRYFSFQNIKTGKSMGEAHEEEAFTEGASVIQKK